MKKLTILFAALCLFSVTGCGTKVARVSPNDTIDLSGRWNDADSRLVAEEMLKDCLGRPWLAEWVTKGRKPVVIVGTILNKSHEHINTETFANDILRELTNSGRVDFVADKGERSLVREERQDQQENASVESAKAFHEESGADYMLIGSINTIVDQEGRKAVLFYQTDLELVHMESNKKVWIGDKKIKKYVTRTDVKF